MKRKLIYVVILLLVVLALFLPGLLESLPVRSAQARTASMRVWVEERGRTSLPRIHEISMPIDGRLLPIEIEEGDAVKKGQVLARLEPVDLDSELRAAQARVHELDAELAINARKNFEELVLQEYGEMLRSYDKVVEASREKEKASDAAVVYSRKLLKSQEESYAKKASSGRDLWQAQLLKAQAEVELTNDRLITNALIAMRAAITIFPSYVREYQARKGDQRKGLLARKTAAEAALERIRRDRSRIELRSPVSGLLLSRHQQEERVLPAGTLLLELGRPEDLQVSVDLLTQDAMQIRPGNPVEISGSGLGVRPMRGQVLRRKPRGFTKLSSLGVEQQRVEILIALNGVSTADKEKLGVDSRLRVRIFTDQKPEALLIPRRALIRGAKGSWSVYRIQDGRAIEVQVEIGLVNDDEVEILEGLDPGDHVVISPSSKLEDGSRVSESD